MLPAGNTSKATNQSSDTKSNYQVLNISNVNAQNEIVLNDECLLGHIQSFPFLYNPNVKPFNDTDYNNYAWEQITKGFNRSYETLDRNVWYTTAELQERWNVLQPIVRSLSKISNMKSLPDSLRQTVIKMSVPMEEAANSYKKPLTAAQVIILQNISMVKKLPMVHRRRLEAEMMELILNSELDSKATVKLGQLGECNVEKEYREFMKAAGLKTLHMKNDNDKSTSTPIEEEILNTDISNTGHEVILPPGLNKTGNGQNETLEDNGEDLLKPLKIKNRWVPLSQWRHYVRNCCVRVKRTSLEDDIPLARIKRERIGL